MKNLVQDFIEQRTSRRAFLESLAALGISATGIQSIVRASEAVDPLDAPLAARTTGTGGELMVAQMKAAGVRYLFTNPGSFEVGFFDAFLNQPQMQLILGLHEGLVVAMADGYHKVSRQPGFVNLHVVAGTAQAAGQLYNASRDGSALIVTAALLDNQAYTDDLILAPRPGYDQKEINRQFTKYSCEVHEAGGIPVTMRRAFKLALTEPTGPVYLAVPNTALERPGVTADVYDRRHFLLPTDIPPSPPAIEKTARLLLEARSPAMILADEVTRAGAQPEALELAELLGLPVFESPRTAFHSFPRRHSLFVSLEDQRGRAPAFLKGKDLILNVGENDLGDYDPREHPIVPVPERSFYDPGARVIRIGLNPTAIGRTNAFSAAIVANPKLALRALIDSVKSLATAERLARLRADRWSGDPRRDVALDPARRGLSPMHPDELGWALEQELDRDAVIVSENLTGANHFLSTGFRDGEKMWVSMSGSGLGWGVGAATGAKLAAPDRQVVCNIGDGSVMYSAAGFWTQARFQVPVLTVVCNNRNYQSVRGAYHRYGGAMKQENRYPGCYLGEPNIDYVKLAASQGIEGVRVEESKDLRAALRRGIASTRAGSPFLVEVVVRCLGGGADSTWHQAFSLAKTRKKAV